MVRSLICDHHCHSNVNKTENFKLWLTRIKNLKVIVAPVLPDQESSHPSTSVKQLPYMNKEFNTWFIQDKMYGKN